MSRYLTLSFTAMLLSVAACSTAPEQLAEQIAEQAEGVQDVQIKQDDEGVTVEVQTDEGSASIGTGTELPDDFPMPVPNGFTAQSVFSSETSSGKAFTATLTGPADAADSSVALYEDFLQSEGFEVSRFDASGGGFTNVTLSGERDGLFASALISSDGTQTTVTLSWGG